MAGLDVIQDCFTTFRTHYGERLAAPAARTELVNAGHNGVKRGGGFVIPEGDLSALIACRNTAYAKLGQLARELGSAPLEGRALPRDGPRACRAPLYRQGRIRR